MFSNQFESFLGEDIMTDQEIALNQYELKLKTKCFTGLRLFGAIFHEQKRALESVMCIPYRFRVAECFIT